MIRLGVDESDIETVINNHYSPVEIAERALKRSVSLYKNNDSRVFITSVIHSLKNDGLPVNIYQVQKRANELDRRMDKKTIREYFANVETETETETET